MTQHTKEPWTAHATGSEGYIIQRETTAEIKDLPVRERLRAVSPIGYIHGFEWETLKANANHIVACVNACEGMADPGAEIKRLKRYDEIPECHHGHISLPLHLWDCPTCTENLREDGAELLKALERIDALLNNSEIYNHAWTNAPEKPEIAPRDIVKATIARAKP